MLFENSKERKGKHDHALLRRDILFWYLKSIESGKPIESFKLKDVGYYLFDTHQPFINEFGRTYYNRPSKLGEKRTYITDRIKDLIFLGLIKIIRTEPSERNKNLQTDIYTFTEDAHVVSLLLEAWYTSDSGRQATIEKFLLQICKRLAIYSSSLTKCLVDCFTRFVKEGYCQTLDEEFLRLFLPLFPLANNPFRFVRFSLMNILYSNELASNIFLEVLEKLEEEEKKLILLQLKLDIESNYFDGIGASSVWELTRYENISNPYRVTIQGYCLDCKKATTVSVKTEELLRTEQKPKMNSIDVDGFIAKRGGCNTCVSGDARIIYPLWFNPAKRLLPNITNFDNLEKAFALYDENILS